MSPTSNLTHQQDYIQKQFNNQLSGITHLDVQEGRLWDSLYFPRGSTIARPRFFESIGPTFQKTYTDTNLQQSRKLDPPEAFSIRRVIFSFSKDSLDRDIYTLAEEGVWSLWLGHKRYLHSLLIHMQTHNCAAPFRTCSYCCSVFANASICPNCGACSFTIAGDFDADPTGRQFYMDLTTNISIVNQISFHVEFECNPPHTLSSDLKFWCHFEGLHARGIQ